MKSSYKSNIDFGEIISSVTFLKKPKYIVEIGILEGYSLSKFINSSSKETKIDAYDIFDKFNGKSADKQDLEQKFHKFSNVNIKAGDFYDIYRLYPNKSIDILHVDIANNGDVFDYVFNHYIDKIKDTGIILLEGGSEKRDNVEWMIKYNKTKIQPVIEKYKDKYDIKVVGEYPSLTIICK